MRSCRMRKDGGFIYIQITSTESKKLRELQNHKPTGIAALSRQQAIEYWQLATGEAAEHYGAG
jgi:hypothetical protein